MACADSSILVPGCELPPTSAGTVLHLISTSRGLAFVVLGIRFREFADLLCISAGMYLGGGNLISVFHFLGFFRYREASTGCQLPYLLWTGKLIAILDIFIALQLETVGSEVE